MGDDVLDLLQIARKNQEHYNHGTKKSGSWIDSVLLDKTIFELAYLRREREQQHGWKWQGNLGQGYRQAWRLERARIEQENSQRKEIEVAEGTYLIVHTDEAGNSFHEIHLEEDVQSVVQGLQDSGFRVRIWRLGALLLDLPPHATQREEA